jgi:hypothetical protein
MSLDDDRNMYVNCELTRKTDMVYFCGRSFSSDIVERYRKPIRILEQLASDKNPTPLQHRSIERWTNDCCVFQTKLEYWLSQKANETNLVPVGDGKFVRSDEIMNAGYVWWNCETYDFLLLYAQCSKHPVPEDRMLSLLHYFDIWFWPRYEFWKFHGLYVIVAQATDPYDSSLLINYERATVNKLVRLLHFDTLAIRYFYKTPLQLYEAHVNWLRMHPPQKSVLKLVRAQTIGAPLEVLRIE